MVSMFSLRISSMSKPPRPIGTCFNYLCRITIWLLFIHGCFIPPLCMEIIISGSILCSCGRNRSPGVPCNRSIIPISIFGLAIKTQDIILWTCTCLNGFQLPIPKTMRVSTDSAFVRPGPRTHRSGPISWLRHVRSSQHTDLRCHRLIVIWPWNEVLFRFVRTVFHRSDGRPRWILPFKAALALHGCSVKSVFQGWFNLTK